MIYLLQTVDADARTTVLDLEEAAAAGLSFFCSSAAAMAVLALAAAATDAAMAVVTAVAMAVLTAAGLSSFFCFSAAATAAELVSDAAMAVVTAVDADANLLQTKLGRLLPSQFYLCNIKNALLKTLKILSKCFPLTFFKKLCRI